MKFIDPVPITPTVAKGAVFPWSPDRVCPEVTGKLPVASINGIFPSLSKKDTLLPVLGIIEDKIGKSAMINITAMNL